MADPTIISTDNTGMVILDMKGKRHTYRIDGAQIPHFRRYFARNPWGAYHKYLKGHDIN